MAETISFGGSGGCREIMVFIGKPMGRCMACRRRNTCLEVFVIIEIDYTTTPLIQPSLSNIRQQQYPRKSLRAVYFRLLFAEITVFGWKCTVCSGVTFAREDTYLTLENCSKIWRTPLQSIVTVWRGFSKNETHIRCYSISSVDIYEIALCQQKVNKISKLFLVFNFRSPRNLPDPCGNYSV